MGCDICSLLFAVAARLEAIKSHFHLMLVLQPAGSELGVVQELLLANGLSGVPCPSVREGRREDANAISHLDMVLGRAGVASGIPWQWGWRGESWPGFALEAAV